MIDAIIDAREITRTLDRLAGLVNDLRPVMADLSADMLDAVKENFDQEGRPSRWPALAPSTLRPLARKGKTGKMLNRSAGGLYHSISRESNGTRAIVGTNKIYAAIHQFGGKAGRGRRVTIPARPYLVLTDADQQRMLATLRRHLER